MSSLTDTANTVKRVGVVGVIGAVAVGVIIVTLIGAIAVKNKYFPAKPEAVELSKFGKITPINFLSQTNIDPAKLNFQIETVSGDLGTTPPNEKVFKFVVQSPAILGLENAKATAEKMGFVSEPQNVEGVVYQWIDEVTGRVLTYNIVSKNFNIESERIFSPEYVSVPPPGNEAAIKIAKSWLNQNNLFQKDFDESKIVTRPIKVEVTRLKEALSLSEANYVEVSFRRENINEIPVVEPSVSGLVSILVTGNAGRESIAQVNYKYNQVDEETYSHYPLITSEEAFAKLKSGEGKVISSPVVSGTVFIRKVYLAYYLSDFDDEYLQPVVVFDSLDGFVGVSPAIKDDQFEPESVNQSKKTQPTQNPR
ncbi:hypothetical protein KBB41_00160 [Candidatus Curtissbacteria bacterium]|nr:hypothetical protein [Candidatus Curtissbacteria bacterium]